MKGSSISIGLGPTPKLRASPGGLIMMPQRTHNDPPLTILATFTVPAPISVAVRLRRVWYRSAAPIVASNGLHLSSVPKVVDLFMSPRTPRTSNWSLATLRRPLRYAKMTVASPGRTRISAARRAASAHARREFVRTKVGIRL